MLMVCNVCRKEFTDNDLTLTSEGFGCPYCHSINYNGNRDSDGRYDYNKVSVKYEEGPHD